MRLDGVHHISCTTADARGNVEYYTGVLGLRLVAKSVNQDDPRHYHLFYADENGRPGADLTFFEYRGARPGVAGQGMVHTIVHRVGSVDALEFWLGRLDGAERDGDVVTFSDPEGLRHELRVDDSSDTPLRAEHPEIPAEHALRGFAGVRAYTSDVARSGALLELVLGATQLDDDVFELRGDRRGGFIEYDPPPPGVRPQQGAGVVHHVAWGSTIDDHPVWQSRLAQAGIRTSGIVDRHYFKSIYFREPSGVLFELADDGPGFTVDGLTLEQLGSVVILPPFLEARRAEIEAGLTPLPDPRG